MENVAVNMKVKILPLVATFIISLEWITMLSTQLHTNSNEREHWKKTQENDPSFVKLYFSNRFHNPIGMLGVYGLFTSGMFTYASLYPAVYDSIPFFFIWQYLSYLGRIITIPVEFWLCWKYIRLVLEKDKQNKNEKLSTKTE